MHEFSIVNNLFLMLKKHKKQKKLKKIKKIIVEIGEISGIEIELFEYAFKTLKNFEEYEEFLETELQIERKEAKVKCLNCKKEFKPENFVFICPFCKSFNTKIIQGEDLILKKIEAEI
ncbi:hydrogenase maturation nickel metallochaperone HypA [Candidatus Pacearchaeota archaeon]|nr:MAG: hydrogenase maturation nickel metallochaperone HypA [Candidatus Pacearchaeota archaeon]